ncbi:twin-arginine translocase TatA/TatE family subunit [Gorillibacterium sp. sgz5001074]|uniref:twin-arginine translocase TatA/TatE family subunit n=1 Tax=Gorillibacterium sp. sgz5001074 TaxID=3446695 RepID=UPI003F673BED
MLNGIGPTGIILIILVALLLWGPNKLPELGRAFGRTLREFKEGAKDIMEDDSSKSRKDVRQDEPKLSESRSEKSEDTNRRLPD